MADIGYTLDSYESRKPPIRPWIVVVIIVTLVTVGLILLVRALGSSDGKEEKEAGETVEQVAEPAAPAKAPTPVPAPAVAQPLPADLAKEASPRVLALFEAGRAAEKADDFFAARTNYLAALEDKDCGNARPRLEERLGFVDVELIFTPRQMDGKIDHAILSGESIKLIANKFGTTVDLIVKANSIANPNRIQVGDRIRVLDHPKFEIRVSKKANDLLVTMDGRFFKRYKVGTGKYGKTPPGTFKINDKIPEPPWWRPDGTVVPFGDKENILGTRWMSIVATGETPPAAGYGIHGTWDDSSLGSQSSAGCVRMNNGDVEELFTYVPVGTPVIITE